MGQQALQVAGVDRMHLLLGQRLADGDAHVLVGVVIVDVGVAHGVHLQIDQPMAADLMEHVIQKRHAGVRLAATGAIEVELHAHIGFTGDAVDLAATHVSHRLAALDRRFRSCRGATRSGDLGFN